MSSQSLSLSACRIFLSPVTDLAPADGLVEVLFVKNISVPISVNDRFPAPGHQHKHSISHERHTLKNSVNSAIPESHSYLDWIWLGGIKGHTAV